MSRYYLSEAYASIYNPRLQEDFDDNLRFIDYMLDEDIEEVVESLFWEFRDYGHSIDESIELLRASANDEILCESMDYLAEANPYAPAGSKESQQYNKFANKAKSDWEKPWRDAQRRATRKARIDGAISRVKSAWKGATGGLGRAAKAVRSGVSKAGEFVNQQREAGKVKLQKLIRTGKAKVERTKRDITGETGRTKALRARSRYDNNKERRAETAKSSVGAPFTEKGGALVRTSSNNQSSETRTPAQRSRLERIAANRQRNRENRVPDTGSVRTATGTTSAQKKKTSPAALGPKGTTLRTQTKDSSPGSLRPESQRILAMARAKREGSKALAKKIKDSIKKKKNPTQTDLQLNSMSFDDYYYIFECVLEDLINEGYAHDEYDALNIINTLNEDTLYDITQEYLFG